MNSLIDNSRIYNNTNEVGVKNKYGDICKKIRKNLIEKFDAELNNPDFFSNDAKEIFERIKKENDSERLNSLFEDSIKLHLEKIDEHYDIIIILKYFVKNWKDFGVCFVDKTRSREVLLPNFLRKRIIWFYLMDNFMDTIFLTYQFDSGKNEGEKQ